jgi:uncharacterized membrane protein YkoI
MQRRHLFPTWLAGVALALGGQVHAEPANAPALTLEQAVTQVQQDTGGKVLSADPRRVGHHTEYRIKVLTPDGHVRVIVMNSENTEAVKNPAGHGPGNKEKH